MEEFNSDNYLEQRQKKEDVTANFTPVKILFMAIILAGFSYLAWYAYNSSGSIDDASLPLIAANKEQIKSKPENPGGLVVANRDKDIYDGMSGKAYKKTKKEKPVTPPEAPVSKEDATKTVEENIKTLQTPAVIAATKSDFIVTKDPAKKPEPAVVAETQPQTETAPVMVEPQPAEQVSELDRELADIKTEAPAEPKQETSKIYSVRIAALKNEQAAIEAWNSLKSSHHDVLGGLTSEIQIVERDGKTIYYLHAGPIKAKDQADQVCAQLQAQGRRCRVY